MNWAELKIPKWIRKPKGAPVPATHASAEDITLAGDSEMAQQLIANFLARVGKVASAEMRACRRLVGKGTPDKYAGELLGAAHGRYWYVVL